MQTLHIYGNDSDVQNILRYINDLSSKGSEIEILDNSVYEFEKTRLTIAIQQVENNEVFSTDDVLKAIRDEN